MADVRRYFSPNNGITFAARGLHFGRYGNNLGDTRNTSLIQTSTIQPYFLGYETLIRGYSYSSFFDGAEDRPPECGTSQAGGCPVLDRLFGHRLGVVNFEIRVPFFGNERIGLFNFPYLPTEVFGFADAGLAFNSFGDVEFTFPGSRSEKLNVPVFSAGFGARFNLFGFLILELHRAYPFQRPERGAHWGLVLTPGW